MVRRTRLGLVLAGLLGGGLLLQAAIGAVWRHSVVPRFERRLGVALGRQVRVGSVRPGWRTITARDVQVKGAPPFAAGTLARARRVELQLGRAADGTPGGVTIEGFDVDYLRTRSADNLRGTAAGDRAPRGTPPDAAQLPLRATDGRVRAFVELADRHRLAARLDDVSMEAGHQGPALLRARHAVVEMLGTMTVEMGAVFVDLDATMAAGSFHGEAATLRLPGAEPLLEGLQVEGRFGAGQLSFDARRGSPGREGSVEVHMVLDGRSAQLAIDGYVLPLNPLRPLLAKAGIGVEHAVASVHGAAELDIEHSRLLFELDLEAERVEVRHRAIDTRPWSGLSGRAHLQGELELAPRSRVRLEGSRVEVLGVPLALEGSWQISPPGRGEVRIATGTAGVTTSQPIDCAGLLRLQPAPVRTALAGLEMDGRLRAYASASFDTATREVLAVDISVPQVCRATREPAALESIGLLSGEVVYNGRDVDGRERPFPLGPSNPFYVPLRAIPRNVIAAFTTSEDYSFFTHHGFDLEMIRRAANYDLRTSSFAKGASTISQQLAKNLFLRPDRNLARKLEEVVFTWRLESLLSKERILELYLNAIELGPGIHGVKDAANAYFGKQLAMLTALESAHLAALAPNPRVYSRQFREGHIDPSWLQHLDELLSAMQRRHMLPPGVIQTAQSSRLQLKGL